MTVTFIFNFLNHHQVLVADEMYKLLGDDFHFVATFVRDPSQLKGGVDYSARPYCLLAAEGDDAAVEAHRLNRESDVCVFGAGNLNWVKERADTDKLSFEVSERWLKKGWRNVFSPRLIKWWLLYQNQLKHKPFYRLCCSAFTAGDDVKLGCYRGRHYKWGYFTKVGDFSVEAPKGVSTPGSATILWCARFLVLKHPELAVKLAARLKEEHYDFVIDMYGEGVEQEKTKKLCEKLNVSDVISFKGNVPNKEILQAMRQHDIFLFTSNRLEGWGAVVNEAMANECCVVASDAVGSVPYLISEMRTGLTFQSGNLDSLCDKVRYLLDHPEDRKRMAKAARRSMVEEWSPANAAQNLMRLIDDIRNGRDVSIQQGPCSVA